METLHFCSLSSGSSGNCYYLGYQEKGLLIDAGISALSIKKHLQNIGKSIGQIMGIVVTHNHHDHIAGLQTLSKKYHIPIYTTETVWRHILRSNKQREIGSDCIRHIQVEKEFDLIGFSIQAFRVLHDTPEALGYYITCGQRKITVVTDLGHICSTAARFIQLANFLIIESNYDRDMLLKGTYPEDLKRRILGKNGHLENSECADFLATHRNPDLTHIFLAHLSRDNNTPELALKTMTDRLLPVAPPPCLLPEIAVLQRNSPSKVYAL